ncbi:hypothetical protein [Shimia sp.]|uniref:hypothetical protein n=1 Tax=Shimia sp. TaxID=1954381 RepID=UPI0035669AC2
MNGLSKAFFGLGIGFAVLGMAWGIEMSVRGDHMLSPAHAHLNLVGYVSFAIFGVYYHLVPAAAGRVLARVHFALSGLGVLLMVPGIVMAIRQTGETLAKFGSLATIAGMLVFGWVVLTSRAQN